MNKTYLVAFLLVSLFFFSFTTNKGKEIAVIQTSAECNECKNLIEEKLNYTKGITFAELDLATGKLTVKYSSKKITLENIKLIISELGYQADEIPANTEAYDKLPACCKVGGMNNK